MTNAVWDLVITLAIGACVLYAAGVFTGYVVWGMKK
jgi:hypothetical protein